MAWLWRLIPVSWGCQRNLSKAQIWSCHFPAPNPAVSPHDLRDKVQALRLASKSSRVWTLLTSRLLSGCRLPHYPCSSHFKLQASNILSSCPKGFCLCCCFAWNHPPTSTPILPNTYCSTSWTPPHLQEPARVAFPPLQIDLTTSSLIDTCRPPTPYTDRAPLTVLLISLCVFILWQLVNYLRVGNVSWSSLDMSTSHSAGLRVDAQ